MPILQPFQTLNISAFSHLLVGNQSLAKEKEGINKRNSFFKLFPNLASSHLCYLPSNPTLSHPVRYALHTLLGGIRWGLLRFPTKGGMGLKRCMLCIPKLGAKLRFALQTGSLAIHLTPPFLTPPKGGLGVRRWKELRYAKHTTLWDGQA